MSLKNSCVSVWEALPVTLSNGTSLTGRIDLGGLRLFAISMPAVWTAASLSFQVSPDGGTTWTNMFDQNGNEVVAAADSSQCVLLNPTQFSSFEYIRIRSGTLSAPVNQGADRSLQLILRSV